MPKQKNWSKENKSDSFIYVPSFVMFDEDELPEGANWETGKRYKIQIEVEKVGERQDDDSENRISSFKIIHAHYPHDDGPEYLGKLIHPKKMKIR